MGNAQIRTDNSLLDLMGNAQIRTDSRVLDVGCGAGNLLDYLQDLGFTDLTGIDPVRAGGHRLRPKNTQENY